MNLPSAGGEPGNGVPGKSASRALILGSARPVLISRLSLATISADVFLGAPKSNPVARLEARHEITYRCNFGQDLERVAVVTARARNLPA